MATDDIDRDALIVKYYPMVQRIAARMASRYPTSVDVGDLVGVGTLGLIDAAQRFDPLLNASFSSYALIRIKGAIVDGLRKQDWVPRSVRTKQRELDMAERTARQSGEEDTSAAVAKMMNVDETALRDLRESARALTQISMWETRGGGEQSIADTLQSDEATPGDDFDRRDEALRVRRALGRLPERDQTIARLHYYENKTFKQIGDLLGVTESRISQLHTRLKRRLIESLAEEPE
jgi:RNA polymerase sigma factor for flagellar operon FliA